MSGEQSLFSAKRAFSREAEHLRVRVVNAAEPPPPESSDVSSGRRPMLRRRGAIGAAVALVLAGAVGGLVIAGTRGSSDRAQLASLQHTVAAARQDVRILRSESQTLAGELADVRTRELTLQQPVAQASARAHTAARTKPVGHRHHAR